jgi:hypothetical protein
LVGVNMVYFDHFSSMSHKFIWKIFSRWKNFNVRIHKWHQVNFGAQDGMDAPTVLVRCTLAGM